MIFSGFRLFFIPRKSAVRWRKIHIYPFKPQKIAAPCASLEAKFNEWCEKRIACLIAGLHQRFSLLGTQPDVALILYGRAFHVLRVHGIELNAEPTACGSQSHA